MLIIYTEKFAYFRGLCAPRPTIFLAMTLVIASVSSLAWAEETLRCPPIQEETAGSKPATWPDDDSPGDDSPGADEDSAGFRRLAAPFAPAVAVRVWYQTRTQTRGRARAYVITKPALPDQILSVAHEPFGWQVSLSWNLVDIARTILPGDETPLRLYASDCAAFDRPMDALFEYVVRDDLEGSPPGEDPLDAQGDLQ